MTYSNIDRFLKDNAYFSIELLSTGDTCIEMEHTIEQQERCYGDTVSDVLEKMDKVLANQRTRKE